MIEAGDRVLLVGEGREFFVKAGPGNLGTDKGQVDLSVIVGKSGGDLVTTHSGAEFTIRIPRPTDFFTYGKRSGAPMLPKDIGLVIAYTGMNHNDDVLDAGTGSGIAAIYFGGIARSVKTYEIRPEFSALALKNITEAKLDNVEAVAAPTFADIDADGSSGENVFDADRWQKKLLEYWAVWAFFLTAGFRISTAPTRGS